MRRSAVLLLTATLLAPSGCAYKKAMRQGDRAAHDGDWLTAFDAYQAAFVTKPKPEAGQAVRDAQVKAVEVLMRDGRAGVQAGDWVAAGAAYKRLAGMGGEDQSARLELRDLIKAAYLPTIDELLANNPEGAYDLALRGREMFGPELFADEGLDRVRSRYRTRAEELQAQGRFAEGLGLLETILKREPEQEQTLAYSIAQAKEQWADQLAGQAAQARARHPGVSAVLLARAYEVANRAGDLSTAQAQAEPLAEGARVRLHVKAEGDPGRVRVIRDTVRANLEEGGLTVKSSDSSAHLLVTLDVQKPACTEAKTEAPQTKEFVASQIDVPSPESVALMERLSEAQKVLEAAEAEVAKVAAPLEAVKAAFAGLDGAYQKSLGGRDEAKRTLDRAKGNLAQQQALLAKLEGQLAAAMDDTERKALQSKVAAISANVLEWEEEVAEWQQKLDATAGDTARTESERAPAQIELASAQASYDAAAAKRDAAKKAVNALNDELSRTPSTMKQDVMETLAYDVVTWTRTCQAPVVAGARVNWNSALEKRHRWDPTREAVDTAQPGHTKAGIPEDKKAYPRQDGEDLAAIQSEVLSAITAWIDERVKESLALKAEAAIASAATAPDAATDQMVALYVAAGPVLPAEVIQAFAAHLTARHGLQDITRLRESATGADPTEGEAE